MDWISWIFGSILAAIFLGFVYLLVVMLPAHVREREEAHAHFMEDCQKDHKEYECTAMYRQTTCRDDSTIIMMPMYTGR